MKYFLVLVAVAVAHADVSHLKLAAHSHSGVDAEAPVLRNDVDISPEGNFQYAYETGNGIAGQASGVLKNGNTENAFVEVQGSNQYTAPDGTPIQLSFVANENGYQPQGAHLPTPPPVPAYILKALDWTAAHPAKPDVYQARRN